LISRIGKTLLTVTLGLYFLLVGYNNIADYDTNFHFVEHVLSMDSIPADSNVQWRAIHSVPLHHLAYWVIIVWELTSGILCAGGALALFRELRSPERFQRSAAVAITGLWLGLLLWALAFITVGGEWFMMWESSMWNGETAALRMFILTAVALLFFYIPGSLSQH